MKLDNRLENKVAIVTGGNVGIGRAISLRLAAEGADVAITGRGFEDSRKVADEVGAMGRKALAIKMDVAIMEDAKRMAKETLDKFGKIDILCNVAGGPDPEGKPFYEKTEEVWNRVVAVNLIGQFNCVRAVINHMIERRYGKILNMASAAGMLGMVNMTDYAASKGGVIAFTMSLAKEVAQFNINVNAVSPGSTMSRGLQMFPDRREEFSRLSGIGRMGKPEEIAALVAYLVSDEAGYVTGQNYPICGLWNLGRV
jgi:NAD(P)-dependent dehydrogenase (short-subunit alcohol dehydrogenase family)